MSDPILSLYQLAGGKATASNHLGLRPEGHKSPRLGDR